MAKDKKHMPDMMKMIDTSAQEPTEMIEQGRVATDGAEDWIGRTFHSDPHPQLQRVWDTRLCSPSH